jgi:NAD(P)-dependent dehydrogenase (short-subunit alcohol dehydrogenase family)
MAAGGDVMRCAVVTGAGTGIGRATTLRLARDGFAVVLAGRRVALLQEVAREITAAGGRALAVAADVSRVEHVDQLVQAAMEAFGRIDVVVNNAGCVHIAPLPALTIAQWRELVDSNLSAAFYMTRAVWPIMRRQFEQSRDQGAAATGGVLINISSVASKDPFPGLGAYGAAKAGLNLLTQATARDGRDVGIRAVCVAPAAVETGMFKKVMGERPIPEGVMLQPGDVAAMIAEAVDGTLRYCSGDTIFIHRRPA